MAAMTPEQAQKLYAEKDRRYSNPSYGDLSHLYEPQQSQQEYGYGSSGPQMSKPGSSTWLEQNNTALQSMNPEQRQQYQQAASRQFQQQMTSPPPAVAQPVGRPQSQPWAQQEAQRQPLVPPTPQRPAAPPRPQATQPQQRQPLIPPKPATPAPPQSRPPAQQPAPQRPPVQQPPPQRPQTSAQNIMGGGWSGDVNTGSTYGEMNDPMAGYYAGLQQQSQPSRQPLVPSARPQGGGQGAVPFDTGMYGPVPPSGRPQFGNQPPRQAAPPMPGRGYDPNQDNYGMPGSITRPDEAMYATIGQPIQPRGVVDMPSYRPPVQSSQQRPPLIPPKPRR